jgi:hypothetical protein
VQIKGMPTGLRGRAKEDHMTGTEKQVAWASQIVEDGRKTIAMNLERNKKEYERTEAKCFLLWARVWKKLDDDYENALTDTKCDDAQFVIDNRAKFDPEKITALFNQICRQISNRPELADQLPNV